MISVKYLLGLLFVFLLFSSTVYALTSEQQAIIKEKKHKITEKLSEKLADARGTEEYEILVELTDGSATGQFASVMKKYMSSTKRLAHHSLVYVGKADADTIVALMNEDVVKYVELQQDILPAADAVTYNVNATGAPLVWENTTGSGVKVAILDTGIATHTDLNIAGGTSIVSPTYTDNDGHGTEVAGVLGAVLNDNGLAGVAPNVSLYAVKVMETTTGNLSDAIDGMQWAIDNNMSIVVMSFGFDGFSNIFRDKVNTFYANGGLSVAAAGNDGGTVVKYPAKYSKVIAVGATDETDGKASFSPSSVDIELVAGGVSVNTTALGSSYAVVSGTSFSAPAVAGVIALIWQLDPLLNNTQLRTKLHQDALDLGEAGKDQSFGYGSVRINTIIGNYTPYLDSYWYEVNKWFENGTQEAYASGYGTFDEVTYDDGRYLLIRKYEDGTRLYEELRVVGEYQGISALATQNKTLYVAQDTYINSSNQFSNYGTNNNLHNLAGPPTIDTWVKFKLSSLPSNADILDADLVFYVTDAPSTTDTYTVYGSNDEWDESTLTWDNRPTGSTTIVMNNDAKINSSQIGDNYVLSDPDFESEIQSDLQNNRNSTFILDDGAGNDTATFKSKEQSVSQGPRLIVYYNDPNLDCNATMQVQTVDSNSAPMSGLYVRANGGSNGTTDSLGLKNLNFNPATCNLKQNVSVYCSDNTTFCGNWSETFTANGIHTFKSKQFTCNTCLQKPELKISLSDVNVKKTTGSNYNISLIAHSENTQQNGVRVTFRYQNKNGLIQRETNFSINVQPYANYTTSEVTDLNNIDYLHFYVDTTNIVKNETSEINNYVLFPVITKKIPVSLDIRTGYSEADEAIINYLLIFVDNISQSEADVTIALENSNKNPTIQSLNAITHALKQKWSHENGKTLYANKFIPGGKPYTGLVGGFRNSNTNYIFVYGDGIEGTLAAVKKLISARDLFFNNYKQERVIVLDQYDTTGVGVFDVLHNPTNEPVFGKNNEDFGNAVERVLNDNTFEIDIQTVKETSQNTTLRLKHSNTDYSSDYVDAIVQNSQPVVLAHGMHSDLNTWNDFAQDLAENGFDTWIIEPYGGSTTECSTCPVYTIANLTQFYWPALITGVQNYSGQDNLSYVGYDLGCTVALESLELYEQGKANAGYVFNTQTGLYVLNNLSAKPIDTFVGLGCIGNFSSVYHTGSWDFLPYFGEQIYVKTNFFRKGSITESLYSGHIPGYFFKTPRSIKEIIGSVLSSPIQGAALGNIASPILDAISIYDFLNNADYPPLTTTSTSIRVYEELANWSNHTGSVVIGSQVNITNLAVIQSTFDDADNVCYKGFFDGKTRCRLYQDSDKFVAAQDQQDICNNIGSNNKYYVGFEGIPHFSAFRTVGLWEEQNVLNTASEFLKNKSISSGTHYKFNTNCNVLG